ncbi:MAG: leucine--tRNA ligase [Candidatus Omnitrophota bacterium]|nr:leucine--tRNA ligase [Candidatus Omnitrophota bacterium]
MSEGYPFQDIEPKWQRYWEEHKLFRAVDGDARRKKLYVLDMFPYPSGAGLHVGHPEGYTATDIYCRFKRMQGYNVLHPMGWDAFGLPAEQYAIDTGTHPAVTTRRNIDTFRRQITRFGFSYDWDREIDTTDPRYVKWTQWIFLKLYERGLAYMADVPVWWCSSCGTVLANEEVVEGRCERKSHPVQRRPMRQWLLRITAYAERLLSDLEGLDWPEHIKQMQRHWIGKSEGAEVWFATEAGTAAERGGRRGSPVGEAGGTLAVPDAVIDGVRVRRRDGAVELKIFTTRPDTLFGATYMVLSPEHPLVSYLTTDARRQIVDSYRQDATRKSELDRTELAKDKSGVFTGAYAINPVNQERLPIWIADYVLASYGTGAIMAVPAHDQRDLAFALQFGLDVRLVIMPEDRPLELAGMTEAFVEPGRMHDSGPFTGLPSEEGKGKVVEWLTARGMGARAVTYKLRDWLFSRQRYWGEPIPILHCATCGIVPLPESALPVTLPEMADFKPTGGAEPPLAKATAWVHTACPRCRGSAQRETNTMPQWAGSCWYYLRYLDPQNDRAAWDPAKERYWMPVDLYVGGAEHAVLHLLYARFWHKVLYDLRLVSSPEPFTKLVNQGLILGEDGEKMSKSRGNVVNPDDVIDQHGVDALRLYEMFMGPLESVKPWSTRSIEGVERFLNRVWRLGEIVHSPQSIVHSQGSTDAKPVLERKRHETIKRVTEDIEHLRFNTAISAMMEFLNAMYDTCHASVALHGQPSREPPAPSSPGSSPKPEAGASQPPAISKAFETLVLLLSPFAPHLCEELWQRLGHTEDLASQRWPEADAKALEQAEAVLVVQVNGKVRARLTLPTNISEGALKVAVLADDDVKRYVNNQPIQQFIIVPKRLVNIVV